MRQFFSCCTGRVSKRDESSPSFRRFSTRNQGDCVPSQDDMYSAVEGFGRNQSFMSVDSEVEVPSVNLSPVIGQGQESLRFLKRLVTDKVGFLCSGTEADTQLWYLPKSASSGPMMTMGQVLIPGVFDLSIVLSLIMNLQTKPDWDPECLTGQLIGPVYSVNDSISLRTSWVACKHKPTFAGRDFVFYSFSEVTDSTACVVSWSVPVELVPPGFSAKVKSPAHVRAKLLCGGFHVRRIADEPSPAITVTYINQAELGVSAWLSEPVLRKMPKVLNTLKQYIRSQLIGE